MELFEHQRDALEQTRGLNRVLYALDMGLGKTYVASEKMVELGSDVNLVVCQKSKVADWVAHFTFLYPQYEVCDLTDIRQTPAFDAAAAEGVQVVGIINYDLVFRREFLLGIRHYTLILDESSLIQNEQAKRSKFILKMHPDNIILLSGTVVNGRYEHLWSQCQLLGWTIGKDKFWRHYVETKTTVDEDGYPHKRIVGYRNEERLKAKLRAHGGVFVKTADVHDLPEQTIVPVMVPASKAYRVFKEKKIVEVDGVTLVGDTQLSERMYRRMLCGQYSEEKLQAFRDLVESTEDRLIVFYTFTAELVAMEKAVEDLQRPTSVVNGSVKDLSAYEASEDSITYIQYQAGSMGLNLQKANKVIYFTLPDGSSENFEQSKKRIHRIGQDRPCFYYLLLCSGTVEEGILNNLGIKRDRTDYLFEE